MIEPDKKYENSAIESKKKSIQLQAATQLAQEFVISKEPSDYAADQLWQIEKQFAEQLAAITELTVNNRNTDQIQQLLNQNRLIAVVSHHVPIDTEIPVPIDKFQMALHRINKSNLALEPFPDEIQMVSVHEAVLASVIMHVNPESNFRLAKIQAALSYDPIKSIQENDGSILLPYGESSSGGVHTIAKGIKDRFTNSRKTIITGFPDVGRPRPHIDNLMSFRSGIFAATSIVASELEEAITILPIVYGVTSDFTINARVLTPYEIEPSLYNPDNRTPIQSLTKDIDQEVRTNYSELLYSMPQGYFWEGTPYPYGGKTGQQIKENMNKN